MNTRDGVTTDDGSSRIDAEHDGSDDRAFADRGARDGQNSPTSQIEPPVDIFFALEAGGGDHARK